MATLTGQTIADTYEQLIKLDTETLGDDDLAKYLETGKAEDTPISVSTNRVGIGTDAPEVPFHIAMDAGTPVVGANVGLLVHNCSTEEEHASIQIASGAKGNSTLLFSDTDDENIGKIQYWHEDDKMDLCTNDTRQMTILSSGNVGIGVVDPESILHIDGSAVGQSGFDKGDAALWSMYIQGDTDTGDSSGIAFGNSSAENVGAGVLYTDTGTQGKGELSFWTKKSAIADAAPVQRMTIDDAGAVGIGTDSPGSLLEVRGPAGTDFYSAGILTLSTAETTVIDGDVLGIIQFQAPVDDGGSAAILPGAAIWGEADIDFDSSSNDTSLVFATADSSTAIAYQQERMRIDKDGNVGIGTASSAIGSTVEIRGGTGTGFGSAGLLTLSTAEASIQNSTNDVLGAIQFQAPLESGASDSRLPGAAIWAEAEATNFNSSTNSTALVFSTASSETALATTQERMRIDSAGDVKFNGDLIMADGKGINFAAQTHGSTPVDAAGMTGEILDDYETGTWDGVISDGTRDMEMDDDTGYYTKVGNLVHVSGRFSTLSYGTPPAAGGIRITGLPFTIANNAAAYSGGTAAYGQGFDIDPIYPVSYFGNKNTTHLRLKLWDATTGSTDMLASEWSEDGAIYIGFSYRAA